MFSVNCFISVLEYGKLETWMMMGNLIVVAFLKLVNLEGISAFCLALTIIINFVELLRLPYFLYSFFNYNLHT
jgi:hypothetical protein